jgi:shikimate dehydrogenase
MAQEQQLIKLALFGSPVKHSQSPRIHALFAEQAGLEIEYRAVESSGEFLSRDVQRLAETHGLGCNITLPLKHTAFQLANRTSERARRAGAANTLLFENASRWFADNTDGIGMVRDIVNNLELDLQGQRICVLGAGGAAAGILYDLLQQIPAMVTLFNRTAERAAELAESHAGLGNITHSQSSDPSATQPFNLVINATSAGHERQLPPITRSLLAPGAYCYDLNYGRTHKVLRAWCNENGVTCHDGLGMLVEQAAESFRLWTGFEPETRPVIDRIRQDMA